MKSIYINILGLLLTTVFLISCGDKNEKKESIKQPIVKVKVAEAKITETPKKYKYAAKIEAEKQSNLSTRLMGKITFLKVKEGEQVNKGQTLAKIKSADLEAKKSQLQANRKEAEIALKNSRTDLNRIQSLFDKKSATQKELDDIKTNYEITKAKIEAIQHAELEVNESLNYATINAPFNGVITKKLMNEGDLASPGIPILSIQGSSVYKAIAKVPESEINFMNTGEQVNIIIDAIKIKNLIGTISQINPSGGYSGNQYEVTILFSAEKELNKKLKSGLFASVEFENGVSKKILLPSKAIIRKGQLQGLYAIDNQNKAMLRWIRTGKQFNDHIEILSGLTEGEKFILSHKGKLFNGASIVIEN